MDWNQVCERQILSDVSIYDIFITYINFGCIILIIFIFMSNNYMQICVEKNNQFCSSIFLLKLYDIYRVSYMKWHIVNICPFKNIFETWWLYIHSHQRFLLRLLFIAKRLFEKSQRVNCVLGKLYPLLRKACLHYLHNYQICEIIFHGYRV